MSCNKRLQVIIAGALSFLILGWVSAIQAAGPGVHGRVLGHDQDGKLVGIVAGAHIDFLLPDGSKAAQVESDKNGYFKVDLPPGAYLYKIEAKGYRTEEVGRGLRLKQSEGYAIFNLAITQGENDLKHPPPVIEHKQFSKLSGQVVEVTNEGRHGIANARIALRRDNSNELILVESHTGSDVAGQVGTYAITLETGTYHASVQAVGFAQAVDSVPIHVESNLETKRDFLLKRPDTSATKGQGIRGVVTIVDSDTSPPPIKLQIVVIGRGNPPMDVKLDANVSFSQQLPPGSYRVIASADGFPTTESPPVYVMQGKYSQVNLALRAKPVPQPRTLFETFVFEKADSSGKLLPLSGAKVSLTKEGADPLDAKDQTTDASGHAVFIVDEAGEYTAVARLKGYRDGTASGSISIGENHEVGIELLKDKPLPADVKILVDVMDASTKHPLAAVRILARQSSQKLAEAARGVTDARGHAALDVASEGEYIVMAQISGYQPGGGNLDVRSSHPNQISIALKPIAIQPREQTDSESGSAIISGYVAYREPGGQLRSVAGANLIWKQITDKQKGLSQFSTTSNNGNYQIEVIPGRYEVQVKSPVGFESLSEVVDVRPGQQKKYFIVRRTERVSPDQTTTSIDVAGQVLGDLQSGHLSGVPQAEILFVQGTKSSKIVTNRDGRFSVRLSPGQHQVHVRAAGFESLDAQSDVVPGMAPIRLVLKKIQRTNSGTGPAGMTVLNVTAVERQRGVVDALMPPLVGAQIQVKQQGRLLFSGPTNPMGKYTVRLQPGLYSIETTKPGYSDATSTITIAGREFNHHVLLMKVASNTETNRNLNLTVHVSRRGGQLPSAIKPVGTPLSNAQVIIFRGAQQVATGQTNAAGNFSVQLPVGSYAVKVSSTGQVPVGKTIMLSNRDEIMNFQLEGIPSGASPTSDSSGSTTGSAGVFRDQTQLGLMATWYVVEHRSNNRAPWIALGEYSTQREAQAALFRAVEHGQIQGGAPAESRIRTVTRLNRQAGHK